MYFQLSLQHIDIIMSLSVCKNLQKTPRVWKIEFRYFNMGIKYQSLAFSRLSHLISLPLAFHKPTWKYPTFRLLLKLFSLSRLHFLLMSNFWSPVSSRSFEIFVPLIRRKFCLHNVFNNEIFTYHEVVWPINYFSIISTYLFINYAWTF